MAPIFKILIFVSTIAAAGCTHAMQNKFVVEEYKISTNKGDLIGKILLPQTPARITFCLVTIEPATDYTREWAQAMENDQQVENSEISRIRRAGGGAIAICDANGDFAVSSLGSGRWIVLASVFWVVGHGQHKDTFWREVEVQPNKTNQILLTP